MDIELRGELWSNDDADVLRWWGWRDITCPADIKKGLRDANGAEVTLLINSPGGDMTVGTEIASMLRRYSGHVTALYQGIGASAATIAASGADRIEAEPGALLCYHNPSSGAEGDYHTMERESESLRAARDCIVNTYMSRHPAKSRDELEKLMDKDVLISPAIALEYGLLDGIVGELNESEKPPAFVAASGCRMRITSAMRREYSAAKSQERLEHDKKAAESTLRYLRALTQ